MSQADHTVDHPLTRTAAFEPPTERESEIVGALGVFGLVDAVYLRLALHPKTHRPLQGGGTWEALVLAEALVESNDGRVVILDEPAVTFHPTWQRCCVIDSEWRPVRWC